MTEYNNEMKKAYIDSLWIKTKENTKKVAANVVVIATLEKGKWLWGYQIEWLSIRMGQSTDTDNGNNQREWNCPIIAGLPGKTDIGKTVPMVTQNHLTISTHFLTFTTNVLLLIIAPNTFLIILIVETNNRRLHLLLLHQWNCLLPNLFFDDH